MENSGKIFWFATKTTQGITGASLFPMFALEYDWYWVEPLKPEAILHVPLSLLQFNQSRTNGPINAHPTIAQVMPRYNHNNEKQEALL